MCNLYITCEDPDGIEAVQSVHASSNRRGFSAILNKALKFDLLYLQH